jgi:hypothetical protein
LIERSLPSFFAIKGKYISLVDTSVINAGLPTLFPVLHSRREI